MGGLYKAQRAVTVLRVVTPLWLNRPAGSALAPLQRFSLAVPWARGHDLPHSSGTGNARALLGPCKPGQAQGMDARTFASLEYSST